MIEAIEEHGKMVVALVIALPSIAAIYALKSALGVFMSGIITMLIGG